MPRTITGAGRHLWTLHGVCNVMLWCSAVENEGHWVDVIMGKFDWGVWYVIIFLYIQFWIRLAAVSKRSKKVRTVAFPAERSVNKSRDTKLRLKQARICDMCHLHHSFILQSPGINFVLSDIANTPQFQSSWRWQLWCYRSPQDVSTGHGRCHGDNPWKFRNDVMV